MRVVGKHEPDVHEVLYADFAFRPKKGDVEVLVTDELEISRVHDEDGSCPLLPVVQQALAFVIESPLHGGEKIDPAFDLGRAGHRDGEWDAQLILPKEPEWEWNFGNGVLGPSRSGPLGWGIKAMLSCRRMRSGRVLPQRGEE